MGSPRFSENFGKTMGNISPSADALFLALIADKDSHFWNHFRPLAEAMIFTQNSDNRKMRLALKTWAISETHGLPWIRLKFWENLGRPIAVPGFPISSPNRG